MRVSLMSEQKPKDKQIPIPSDEPFTAEQHISLISHRHAVIAYMLASGISQKRIAEDLSYNENAISRIANRDDVKKEVAELREKHYGGSIDKRMKRLMPGAIDVLEDTLTAADVKPGFKMEAAKYVLDQGIGKPVQRHEVKTNMLGDFLDQLDEMNKKAKQIDGKRIEKDVSPVNKEIIEAEALLTDSEEVEPESDPLEDWVQENID